MRVVYQGGKLSPRKQRLEHKLFARSAEPKASVGIGWSAANGGADDRAWRGRVSVAEWSAVAEHKTPELDKKPVFQSWISMTTWCT